MSRTLSLDPFHADPDTGLPPPTMQVPAAVEEIVASPPPTSGKRRILIVQGDWEAGLSLLGQDLMDVGHEIGKVVF